MQIECSPTFMYVITENGASGARGGGRSSGQMSRNKCQVFCQLRAAAVAATTRGMSYNKKYDIFGL
jgi:hypothetical protein